MKRAARPFSWRFVHEVPESSSIRGKFSRGEIVAEELAQFDKFHTEMDELKATIDRHQRAEAPRPARSVLRFIS